MIRGITFLRRGAEFTSNAILAFADKRKLDWHYIAPGKPTQNAFIESFNGRLRPSRRCIHRLPGNGRIAERKPVPITGPCRRATLADWRTDCNVARPHSGIGWQTPNEYAGPT